MQAWYWERGKEQENSSNDNQILPSGGKGEAILYHMDTAEIEAMGMQYFLSGRHCSDQMARRGGLNKGWLVLRVHMGFIF